MENNNVISFPNIRSVRDDVPDVNRLAIKLYERLRNDVIQAAEENKLTHFEEIELHIALIHELFRQDWRYRKVINDR